MTDQTKPVVILVSEQTDIINALVEEENSNFQTVQRTLETMSIQDEQSSVTILGMESASDAADIKKKIVEIKQAHPTQILIVLGEREPLVNLLSPSIQSLVYRVFTMPVSPSQVLLSLPSAIKSHENLKERARRGEEVCIIDPDDLKLLMSEEDTNKKKNVSMIAGILGILLFIGGIFLASKLLVDNEPADDIGTITFNQSGVVEEEEAADAIFSENSQNSRVAELNQLAEDAMNAGNLITPEWESALSYYQQALEIDEFNLTAYIGTRKIFKEVEKTVPGAIAEKRYSDAASGIIALQSIDPSNRNNQVLSEQLKDEITNRIIAVQKNTADAEEISNLNAVLSRLGDEFVVSEESLARLAEEQELLGRIDNAIARGNLVPPRGGNAYGLISQARIDKTVSPINLIERAERLSSLVFEQGKSNVRADNLSAAKSSLNILKKLNVSRKNVASLEQLIEAREQRARLAQAEAQKQKASQVTEQAKKPLLKIVAAKPIKRSSPRYPTRALNRGTEGWVEMKATITVDGDVSNVQVVNSQPEKTFDSAAIKAFKKWQFVPAYDPNTNSPVASEYEVKLRFKLN